MAQSQPNSEKAEKLLTLISSGFHLHAERSTAKTLGDRSKYIGMSDIGRALECPRAALANKVYPRTKHNLQKQLVLQRGHWLEYGIGQALAVHGLHILPQLELTMTHNGVPIKAHLDFVLVWQHPRPAVRILELKSTGNLPETLFSAYETQLYGQAGLLDKMWNEPAFSMRDGSGTILHNNLTMSELLRSHFGLELPVSPSEVDIEAWVLCVSMSDAKPFGPYQSNTSMTNLCLNTAKSLWENMLAVRNGQININDVSYVRGFHHLCGYCDWNSDCPKFYDDEYQPEWESDLEQLVKLKASRSILNAQIDELTIGLKDACNLAGMDGWVNAGKYRFKASKRAEIRVLNRIDPV